MQTFLTIGYGDEKGYESTAPAVRDRAHAHDAWLVAQGAVVGIAGTPMQVRNPDGSGVTTETGAFLRSDLPVAGFALVEAETIEDAIERVASTPCAVAHGVVEVWPLLQMPS
jgi:hypothetical protein